jgi:hypothetical protein
MNLLSRVEQEAMAPFVRRKMAESKKRIVVNWDPTRLKSGYQNLCWIDLSSKVQ